MKVGDLVKVIHDGSVGLVIEIESTPRGLWAWLHSGESFRVSKLEVINEGR